MSKCEIGERTLPLYLDNGLDAAGRAQYEAHLRLCADCAELLDLWRKLGELPEPAPAHRVLAKVGAREPVRSIPVRWVGWAAAAMLLLGAGWALGRWIPTRPETQELTELRREVRSLQTLVAVSLLTQQSAGERLKGVDFAGRVGQGSRDVVAALAGSLRHDSNVNVRLAACDALRRYAAADAGIRREFLEALVSEDSPLVKIAVIDALADLRDRSLLDPLARLSVAAQEDSVVRQRAARALEQIRTRSATWQ
jgi:predicted anti-sigma-YlaC factor YlaD